MSEYMSFCEQEEYEAEEVGEMPSSYADAIRLLDHFVNEAREAVSGSLMGAEYLFRAHGDQCPGADVRVRSAGQDAVKTKERGALQKHRMCPTARDEQNR